MVQVEAPIEATVGETLAIRISEIPPDSQVYLTLDNIEYDGRADKSGQAHVVLYPEDAGTHHIHVQTENSDHDLTLHVRP